MRRAMEVVMYYLAAAVSWAVGIGFALLAADLVGISFYGSMAAMIGSTVLLGLVLIVALILGGVTFEILQALLDKLFIKMEGE